MSDSAEKHVVFEGWRFIPHSSAIALQFHALAVVRRRDLALSVRDRPFNGPWSRIGGMFPEAYDRTLQALPLAAEGAAADAVVRFGAPVELAAAPGAARTFVVAVHGAGASVNVPVAGRAPLGPTVARSGVTLLAPSEFARQGLVAQGAPADRIAVVPRGVDPGFFHPASPGDRDGLRRRFGWSEEFVFLNVSAMTDNKGIDRLLRAFAAVLARHPQARLVLKGVDSIYRSKDHLTGIVRRLPAAVAAAVEPRMTYIGGNYKVVDMTRLYQCADALVAPYLSEAFCLPALEAAACGLPSICTGGGPTEETTADTFSLRIGARWDAAGRTLQPDEGHLAQLMDFVATNAVWRERARLTAPDFAARRFTWQQATDRLLRTIGV